MGKRTTLKSLCPKIVKENTFEGGVSGTSGALSYAAPYGTPSGGNTTQNPAFFGATSSGIGKGPSHIGSDTETTGSSAKLEPVKFLPTHRPDRKSSSGAPIHPSVPSDKGNFENPTGRANAPETDLSEPAPAAKADQAKADAPLNPDQQYDGDVDTIFKKKQTPSPDELMSALQYELGRMVKKDKTLAKRTVLKNLKSNPHHYSQLDMLNIDDKKMKVDESQIARTKSVLDQMISERQKKMVAPPPHLDEIFQELKDRRYGSTKRG